MRPKPRRAGRLSPRRGHSAKQITGRSSAGLHRWRALLGFFGWNFLLPAESELHAEIAALPPPAIETEKSTFIVDERKPKAFVAADRPVPTAARVADAFRKASHARERFVRDADDVEGEIVAGIAHVPSEIPATIARPIPIPRNRRAGVSEPPGRVELFPRAQAAGLARVVGQHSARAIGGSGGLRRWRRCRLTF